MFFIHLFRLMLKHHIPLRIILVVPFALQIFAAVGITGWLSLRNGEKAVNNLTRQLSLRVSERIAERLNDTLGTAPLVARFNVDMIETGKINPNNPRELESSLLRQLRQFNCLTGITIATEQPNYIGISYNEGDRHQLYLSIWNPAKGGTFDWLIDAQGKRRLLDEDTTYDHRKRPWYQDTVKAGDLIWNPIYLTISPQELVTSASQPFYDQQGEVRGVVSIDLSLEKLGQFLQSLRISKTGEAFIIDHQQKLIATSDKQKLYRINPINQEPEQIAAIESSNPLISTTAQHLQTELSVLNNIKKHQHIEFNFKGEQVFAQITPFFDQRGLNWFIVTVIPKSDFMEEIKANTRLTIGLCLVALSIAIGTGIVTSIKIVTPLLKVITAADTLSQGNWQHKIPESRSTELALLGQAFNRMAKQLQKSFTQLEYSAYHDALTGLPNREALLMQLTEAINQSITSKEESLFAVLFLDLDFFKFVNDSFGHLVGDQLLIAVAQRIKMVIRPTDTLTRFGGDEFILLLKPIADISEVIEITEQILKSFQSPFNCNHNSTAIFISTSIGIVLSTMGGKNPQILLRNADIALYRAKANGKNNYEVFNQQMHAQIVERLQLETDLRYALERQEFELYYQPIIEASTLKIKGFEALIRWHHPVLGMVSPVKFIPFLEETRFIIPLGWWVLQEACTQMQHWHNKLNNCEEITISVNITSQQLSHPDFITQIEQILSTTQLAPHQLKLEITESALLNSEEFIQTKLAHIRNLGIQLSLDDFGTAYSSLNYLHRFPINTLKIDRSFILDLEKGGKNLDLVEAIILLAHKLQMNVVAEGVETQRQLEILLDMGCEAIQGYLFYPALPAMKVTEILSLNKKFLPKLYHYLK